MAGGEINQIQARGENTISQPLNVDTQEAPRVNPELGNVSKPSGWAIAGRVFLGIISIGFSELIRMIVNVVTARPVDTPKLNSESVIKETGKTEVNKINDLAIDQSDNVSSSNPTDIVDTLEYPWALKGAMKKVVSNNPNLESWKQLERIASFPARREINPELIESESYLKSEAYIGLARDDFERLFAEVDHFHSDCLREGVSKTVEKSQVKQLMTLCSLKTYPEFARAIDKMTTGRLEQIRDGLIDGDHRNMMQALINAKGELGNLGIMEEIIPQSTGKPLHNAESFDTDNDVITQMNEGFTTKVSEETTSQSTSEPLHNNTDKDVRTRINNGLTTKLSEREKEIFSLTSLESKVESLQPTEEMSFIQEKVGILNYIDSLRIPAQSKAAMRRDFITTPNFIEHKYYEEFFKRPLIFTDSTDSKSKDGNKAIENILIDKVTAAFGQIEEWMKSLKGDTSTETKQGLGKLFGYAFLDVAPDLIQYIQERAELDANLDSHLELFNIYADITPKNLENLAVLKGMGEAFKLVNKKMPARDDNDITLGTNDFKAEDNVLRQIHDKLTIQLTKRNKEEFESSLTELENKIESLKRHEEESFIQRKVDVLNYIDSLKIPHELRASMRQDVIVNPDSVGLGYYEDVFNAPLSSIKTSFEGMDKVDANATTNNLADRVKTVFQQAVSWINTIPSAANKRGLGKVFGYAFLQNYPEFLQEIKNASEQELHSITTDLAPKNLDVSFDEDSTENSEIASGMYEAFQAVKNAPQLDENEEARSVKDTLASISNNIRASGRPQEEIEAMLGHVKEQEDLLKYIQTSTILSELQAVMYRDVTTNPVETQYYQQIFNLPLIPPDNIQSTNPMPKVDDGSNHLTTILQLPFRQMVTQTDHFEETGSLPFATKQELGKLFGYALLQKSPDLLQMIKNAPTQEVAGRVTDLLQVNSEADEQKMEASVREFEDSVMKLQEQRNELQKLRDDYENAEYEDEETEERIEEKTAEISRKQAEININRRGIDAVKRDLAVIKERKSAIVSGMLDAFLAVKNQEGS